MSRENHRLVSGRLLQTDKKFSALKGSQREQICGWLKEEYLKAITERQAPLDQAQKEAVAQATYARIEARGIWIPYHEVRGYLSRKLPGWNRKYLPAGGATCGEREEPYGQS